MLQRYRFPIFGIAVALILAAIQTWRYIYPPTVSSMTIGEDMGNYLSTESVESNALRNLHRALESAPPWSNIRSQVQYTTTPNSHVEYSRKYGTLRYMVNSPEWHTLYHVSEDQINEVAERNGTFEDLKK